MSGIIPLQFQKTPAQVKKHSHLEEIEENGNLWTHWICNALKEVRTHVTCGFLCGSTSVLKKKFLFQQCKKHPEVNTPCFFAPTHTGPVQVSTLGITSNLAAITKFKSSQGLQNLCAAPQRLRHPRCEEPLLVGVVRSAGSVFMTACQKVLKILFPLVRLVSQEKAGQLWIC